MKNALSNLTIFAFLAFAAPSLAHPLPDIAVRASFEQNEEWTLQVEIDPRSFQPDPNVAPYLTNADLGVTPVDQQEKLKAMAREYIKKAVEVVLEPAAEVKPEFVWEFTAMENAPLKIPEDPVMLTGTWRSKLPAGTTGYSIKALKMETQSVPLSVLFQNTALGKKVDREQIRFPGETSYILDLKTYLPRTAAPPPITADSVQTAAADSDPMCALCGTSGGDTYILPVAASVAGIVALVTYMRKKRPA
ncbi:hypothetical protein [Prosthecobacter sp.]|uniref:hypothetical protein n=1 Tax=Prosthecobacter sp. TaxID=1965333 RepID=UPI0037852848